MFFVQINIYTSNMEKYITQEICENFFIAYYSGFEIILWKEKG